jgi:hypothetical protein
VCSILTEICLNSEGIATFSHLGFGGLWTAELVQRDIEQQKIKEKLKGAPAELFPDTPKIA